MWTARTTVPKLSPIAAQSPVAGGHAKPLCPPYIDLLTTSKEVRRLPLRRQRGCSMTGPSETSRSWPCPECGLQVAVRNNKCGCGFDRTTVPIRMPEVRVEVHPASAIMPPDCKRWRVMIDGEQNSVHETEAEAESAAKDARNSISGQARRRRRGAKPRVEQRGIDEGQKPADRWAEIEKRLMEGQVARIEVLDPEARAASRLKAVDDRMGPKKSSAKATPRRERKPQAKGPARAAMAPEELRHIRRALKLTQEQFAEELGVRPLTIGLWEGGKTPISKNRALAIQGLVAKLSGQARRRSEAAKRAWATRRKKGRAQSAAAR